MQYLVKYLSTVNNAVHGGWSGLWSSPNDKCCWAVLCL